MGSNWNKVYRGGVNRTTPTTREVYYLGVDSVLFAGTAVSLDEAAGVLTKVDPSKYWYIVGEHLHGSINDNLAEMSSSLRLYYPVSGDLYAVRAASIFKVQDDMPLTINGKGLFAPAGKDDHVYAYIDDPAGTFKVQGTTVTENQIIPIKIK